VWIGRGIEGRYDTRMEPIWREDGTMETREAIFHGRSLTHAAECIANALARAQRTPEQVAADKEAIRVSVERTTRSLASDRRRRGARR
jgi:hypothetical protein